MKVLELFAGQRSIGKAFDKKNHEVYSIEWDKRHENIDWYQDISTITANDIIERFGVPDIVWASPDCTSYSIAGISYHRIKESSGNLLAKSDYAKFCDKTNLNVMRLIDDLLKINPNLIYFIENPRGGMRKMDFIKDKPRYTVTYCQYGDERMKPTDIWTNHPNPNFKPVCKNGDSCHVAAPRGSRTGTQGRKNSIERSLIPTQLCDHIVNICEEFLTANHIGHMVLELVREAKNSTEEGNWIYDIETIEDKFNITLNNSLVVKIKGLLEENEDVCDVQIYDNYIDIMLYKDSF